MKAKVTVILAALAALALAAILVYGYRRGRSEDAPGEDADQPVQAKSRVERGPDGAPAVNLDPAAQKLIGLQTVKPAASTLAPEVKAYGRVIDGSPLVGFAKEIASARADLETTAKDYARIKDLFEKGENASARAVEAAKGAVRRDQIALDAAQAQFAFSWGSALGNDADLPALVHSLSSMQTALVRLDVPVGDLLPGPPIAARLLISGEREPVKARFLGRSPAIDPQIQGQGFLFAAPNAKGMMAPGLVVSGFLELPGEALRGVIVPDSAVVRSGEKAWIYLQTSPTLFSRREIDLGHPVAGGWFEARGIAPDDRVVAVGAQTLLSEELKSQIKLGD